jgi:ubiquinone/menaquinone biosynthesis C-methylase UbiE
VAPSGTVAGLDVNAGMLAVARALASTAAVPITWYETSAEAMPLPDGSFDVALCQLGLQFIPDRSATLREMRRVLAPGGRAILSLPAPTRFFRVMEDALEQHIGTPAAGFVRLVFSLHEPAQIARLLDEAGFTDVRVRSTATTLRLPAPEEFLWQYIRSTPLADAIATISDDRKAALAQAVVSGWEAWAASGGLAYDQPMRVVSGSR